MVNQEVNSWLWNLPKQKNHCAAFNVFYNYWGCIDVVYFFETYRVLLVFFSYVRFGILSREQRSLKKKESDIVHLVLWIEEGERWEEKIFLQFPSSSSFLCTAKSGESGKWSSLYHFITLFPVYYMIQYRLNDFVQPKLLFLCPFLTVLHHKAAKSSSHPLSIPLSTCSFPFHSILIGIPKQGVNSTL